MENLKLVVGLGNPGKEYENTYHNVGFMFLEYLAEQFGANSFSFDKKLNTEISDTKTQINDKQVALIFAKPQSYMNESGSAISKIASYYKVLPYNIVVAHDDLDIDFGSYKIDFDRNSGGHKGIESTIDSLQTKEFYRVRIGISTQSRKDALELPKEQKDNFVRDFVLDKIQKEEREVLKKEFQEIFEKLKEILIK
jgi:peptidyl-tRNA hydrolase, PTH1 family